MNAQSETQRSPSKALASPGMTCRVAQSCLSLKIKTPSEAAVLRSLTVRHEGARTAHIAHAD
eukprot:945099-Rhodomonas_salina.2